MKISDLWRGIASHDSPGRTFLAWSMDRHAAMKTFEASIDLKMAFGAQTSVQDRHFAYEAPNRFLIVSALEDKFVMTAVCDGKRLVEYSDKEMPPAASYPAPGGVWVRAGMQMKHPMFCGSLIYQFFGGAKNIDGLAQLNKAPIEIEDEVLVPEERAKIVTFYGADMYGHVRATIGADSGRVYRLEYDAEPLAKLVMDPANRERARRAMEARLAQLPPGDERDALEQVLIEHSDVSANFEVRQNSETFREIQVDADLPAAMFDTTPPGGKEPVDQGAGARPPLPIGEPAPEFSVRSLAGESVSLSDLRGSVVLLDLWATWCGPCRRGLPDTSRLAEVGATRGLRVLAITNEPAEVVRKFLQTEELGSLPAFLDESNEVWSRYRVSAIPVTVIIDSEGRLAEYMVGLRPIGEIRAALRDAGATLL